jgi:hypothetical protein
MRPWMLWVVALVVFGLALEGDAAAGAHVHLKLKADASGKFFVGVPLHPIVAPVRLTLHLKHHGKFHTRLVGLGPGRVMFAGVKARPFKLHVKGPGGHLKVGPGGGFKLKGKRHKGHGGGKFKVKF